MAYLAEHAHHVSAARRHASPIACVATDISFHMARLAMLWMRRRDAMFRRKKHQPTLTWSRSRRRAPDLEDDPVSRETFKEPKSYGKSKVTRLSDDVEDDEVDPQDATAHDRNAEEEIIDVKATCVDAFPASIAGHLTLARVIRRYYDVCDKLWGEAGCKKPRRMSRRGKRT